MVGAHKDTFFDEVFNKHPDYAEWATSLVHPGHGMRAFAEYARKRIAQEDKSEHDKEDRQEEADGEHKRARTDVKSDGCDHGKCVVCLNSAAQCALVPCGHQIVCVDCSARVEASGVCPVCRQEIIF